MSTGSEEHEMETTQRPRRAAAAPTPAPHHPSSRAASAPDQPPVEAYAQPDPSPQAEVAPGTPDAGKAGRGSTARPERPRGPSRFTSDLDLNAEVPTRAQPAIGDWGPIGLPTTREKRRQRWVVPVALSVMTIVVIVAWRYFASVLG